MTESSSMKNWQLEDSADADNQWQLLDTEQELPPEMSLQEGQSAEQGWQPVEQADTQNAGGRNWILPSFIILAMIAVVAYIAWLGFNGVGLMPPGGEVTEATSPAEDPPAGEMAVAPVEEDPTATPMAEPTATQAPTPAPTPTMAMVEQSIATINSEYGLNARPNPSTEGEPIALLDSGAEFVVITQDGAWVQITLEDGTPAWVSADFVDIRTEQVAAEESVTQPGAEEPAATEPTEEPVAELNSTGITPPEPYTDLYGDGPTVLVLVQGGVNARSLPAAEGSDIILTIPQGAALPAVGQSIEGDWLQVELPNGSLAWVFREAVETSGAIDSLAVVGEEAEEAAVVEPETPTATEPLTTTEVLTGTETITGTDTAGTAETAEITVDSLIGIKARSAPELGAEVEEVLSPGSTAAATGRTADGGWVRVQLAGGNDGWVLIGAVKLNVDPADLPVVEP